MRHLVYRVQALPQSLLPLVWDFGTLQSVSTVDAEKKYIKKMIDKFVCCALLEYVSNTLHQIRFEKYW